MYKMCIPLMKNSKPYTASGELDSIEIIKENIRVTF